MCPALLQFLHSTSGATLQSAFPPEKCFCLLPLGRGLNWEWIFALAFSCGLAWFLRYVQFVVAIVFLTPK